MDFFNQTYKLSLLILSLLIFTSVVTQAQTLEEQRLKAKQRLNYLNDITVDTNAQPTGKIDNSSGATYTLGLKYSPDFIKRSNFWLFVRASKRFNRESIFGFLDTILRFEKSYDPFLGFSPRLRWQGTLPSNEFVHEQTSFLGSTSLQARLSKSMGKFYLILTNTLRWNFHEFRVSEVGGINLQNTFQTAATLTYSLSPKLQIGSQAGWNLARTYENNIRANYLLGAYTAYNFTHQWSGTLGASTFASPMTADGRNTNVNIFDERDTTFYLSLTHFM